MVSRGNVTITNGDPGRGWHSTFAWQKSHAAVTQQRPGAPGAQHGHHPGCLMSCASFFSSAREKTLRVLQPTFLGPWKCVEVNGKHDNSKRQILTLSTATGSSSIRSLPRGAAWIANRQ